MVFLKRLLIFFVIFLVLFFVSVSVYVKLYGKNLIEKTLKDALNRDVVIENISYRFPLNLRAQGIRIAHLIEGKKFLEVQDIFAQLSVDAIFQQKLIFNTVIFNKPVVMIACGYDRKNRNVTGFPVAADTKIWRCYPA